MLFCLVFSFGLFFFFLLKILLESLKEAQHDIGPPQALLPAGMIEKEGPKTKVAKKKKELAFLPSQWPISLAKQEYARQNHMLQLRCM